MWLAEHWSPAVSGSTPSKPVTPQVAETLPPWVKSSTKPAIGGAVVVGPGGTGVTGVVVGGEVVGVGFGFVGGTGLTTTKSSLVLRPEPGLNVSRPWLTRTRLVTDQKR